MCENQTLTVLTRNCLSFIFPSATGKSVFRGEEFNILLILSQLLSFNFNMVTTPDSQLGVCDLKSNNCTGFFGMLARQEADMAFGAISPTAERLKFVDFSFTYFQSGNCLITRTPYVSIVNNDSFLTEPLQIQAWLLNACILAAVIAIVKLVTLSRNGLWNIMEIILRQGFTSNNNPSTMYMIIIATTILLFGTMQTLYSCYLTSVATLAPVSLPIDTFEQMARLIKSQGYVVSSSEGNSIQRSIMTSDNENLKIFANSIKKPGFQLPTWIYPGLNRVTTDSYAFLGNQKMISIFLALCRPKLFPLNTFHFSEETLYLELRAIALRKSLPCKEDINKWLHVLMSSGILHKWESKLTGDWMTEYKATETDRINYIKLDDLRFIFYSLVSGWICSCFFLAMEIVKHRLK